MSPQEMKRVARRLTEELFGQGRLEVVDDVVTSDYIEHAPAPPGFPAGPAGLKQFISGLRSAFPDLRYDVEDEVAQGGKVALRVRASGTHRGELFGIPPSGKRITWMEIHMSRLADGMIAEHWVESDQLGLLRQMGAIPASGP